MAAGAGPNRRGAEGDPAVGSLRLSTARGRWVLLATVLGTGTVLLDSTVVNVALARIGVDLQAGFAALQWTVNAYALTLSSLLLLGGSLGDRLGRRRVFVVGAVWFAVASLLCGVAPNIEALIVARALQGVGGALLTPGSLAIISASFAPEDRSAAIGAWSGLGGIAGAIGPLVGGWLVEWTWRAVFLLNLPLAVVVVIVAVRHVPETRDPEAAPGLDWPGTVLVVLGLGGLTYGLTTAGAGGGAASWLPCVVGVLALAALVQVERRSRNPLVPPELFRNAAFSAANAVTLCVYAALGALFVLLVLQLQVVAGYSPPLAGTALLPLTVLMLLFSARVGRLAQRIGARPLLTAGPLVAACGVLLMLRIGPGASYLADVLPATTVLAAGMTLVVAPLTATVLGAAPTRYAGTASGVNNTVARAAGLLAVAVVPVAAGIRGEEYTNPVAFDAGFRTAVLICAGLLVAGAIVAALFVRTPAQAPAPEPGPPRLHLEECAHCGIAGPQLYPREPAGAADSRGTSA